MTDESEEAERIVKELIRTLPEEWKKGMDPVSLRNLIRKTSRELPIEFYQFLKEKMFSFFLGKDEALSIKLRLVVDSNIIIKDAFRVASGNPSTTLRLLGSPFVELIAPRQIIDEVDKQVRLDIPREADLTVALAHAKKLLQRVSIVDDLSIIAAAFGSSKKIRGNDFYFLGLTISSKARAIISLDKKAFDNVPEIHRWEMSKTSEAIVSLESGVLSFSLFSIGVELSGDLLKYLIFPVLAGIAEILEEMVSLIAVGITGIVSALKKVPDWAWLIILAALIGLGIGAAVNEDFRKKVGKAGEIAYSVVTELSKASFGVLKDIIMAIVDLVKLLISTLGPYFVAFGSAIFLTLSDFISYIEEEQIEDGL